jgi:UDP-GlcNAc3NAcA epimerase
MKILTVIGARPQFVKAAVVSRAFKAHADIREILVHTGQHFDQNMSQVFFDDMKIPKPDVNLGVGGGTHGQNTGRMLEGLEGLLLAERPDWTLVYGDTDSTLAGALAASKQHIPVAHVEAGLRSYNRAMPEELNRVITDHVSDLLFAPTATAVGNLAKEGICGGKVVQSGDVMYDAVRFYRALARPPEAPIPQSGFVLSTLHRAENTDDRGRLGNIMEALKAIADQQPVVFPLHPRTRKMLAAQRINCEHPHLHIIDPVGYLQMIWLLERCRLVMTDSGGLQKEACFFEKPCVTLREETEWVELVEIGANIVAGTDTDAIIKAFHKARTLQVSAGALYGDGHSAEHIVRTLLGASAPVARSRKVAG